jgi:hypothetical protein
MNCQRTEELLPWLLNGTLPEAEKALAADHLQGCAACRAALADARFVGAAARQHVPAETLIAYAYERPLALSSRHELEIHLSDCEDCATELELIEASRVLETEEDGQTGGNVVAFTPAPAVSAKPSAHTEPGKVIPFAAPSRMAVWWRYAAIAACLLLTLAAGGWLRAWRQSSARQAEQTAQAQALQEKLNALEAENRRLQQQENELAQAQGRAQAEIEQLKAEIAATRARIAQQQAAPPTATPLVARAETPPATPGSALALDVFPLGLTTRAGDAEANELRIPRHVQTVTLILNTQAATENVRYAVTLRDGGGRVIWRAANVRRSSAHDLTISLPARLLPPGRYAIRIEAAGQAENYQLNVKNR